jgi:hypothetical protein
MKAGVRQKNYAKLVLIACLAIAVCMMPCGAAEHHASAGMPSILCIVDLPQVFQLVIVLKVLLFAAVALILVPQAPAFSLLKPPRSRFALV